MEAIKRPSTNRLCLNRHTIVLVNKDSRVCSHIHTPPLSHKSDIGNPTKTTVTLTTLGAVGTSGGQ
jgi:hypothetical protein